MNVFCGGPTGIFYEMFQALSIKARFFEKSMPKSVLETKLAGLVIFLVLNIFDKMYLKA